MERRLGIRIDGWGGRRWRSPAEAQRGRTEEAAGASKGEVGEEGEAHQHFVHTSWRGKQTNNAGQLTVRERYERKGEEVKKARRDPGQTERLALYFTVGLAV